MPEGNQKLKPSDFVHLHNHTTYSLLDGLTRVNELIEFVKSSGMEAVAVTDHGTMSGLLDLYKTAQAAGVKPILGIEAYVAARGMEDRDPAYDKERFHITLLAQNNQGYENLCRLSTEANLRGFYYKPRTDHEAMRKYSEGIICLSGCAGSEISEAIKANDDKRARQLIEWYVETYPGRFYLEMQDHGHPDSPTHWEIQNKINVALQKYAKDFDLPLVVTCDGHYLKHENQEAHEILLCVGTGSNLSDQNRMTLKDFELHVIPPQEIIERWGKICPEAVRNTKKIADQCNVELELGRILIPVFPVPEGDTEGSYLEKLAFRGLATRYGLATKETADDLEVSAIRKLLSAEVLERIDYELSTVAKMGYDGYFLIVQDFINWGKGRGIVFGPGRGSAAGSLLAYALRITDLDPLKYDLLFERFLNPDRISMPDIDTDIQDTRRDEVVQYCVEKYGAERVSNIATFGKMMGKMAVRDVARVLEVPYNDADRIAKLVPDPNQGHHVPLKEAIEKDADFKHEYQTNPVTKEVVDYAIQLEGTIRSHGVHACGVVIAPDDLVKYMPLEMAQKGVVATQFPMGEVEELGLLKMDFLGLSNLSVIQSALRIIKKVYGDEIDISELPLDDAKTYKLFQRGDTTGVFQFESAGMKRYLRDLKPDKFDDIIAMVALYRPGPMQFIDSFIRRKYGREKITYLHAGLENSLKNTYGILVFQEQFMQISREWCGFTGGQADTLRKAVGKKKIDVLMKMKAEFIEGAVKVGGASEEVANTFWSQLEEFANYCFNKSHAACYAMIAYWTAYLKAHYPDAFMAALMTSDMRWVDRLAIEIAECKRMGIKVVNPDINQSYGEFAIVKGEKTVRFGLAAVKGMGRALIDEVIAERDENGLFTSVCDFSRRVNPTKFNRRSWEAAIKAGAFDSFADRSDLLFNLEKIQAYGAKMRKDAESGQTDLFGMLGEVAAVPEPEIVPAPTKYTDKEQLMWERELMGLYISAHPLDRYGAYLEEQTHPLSLVKPEQDGYQVTVGGIVSSVRTILTKSGSKMAFVRLEDRHDEAELIVFPNLYERVGAKLVQDAVIKATGKVSATDAAGNLTSEAKVIVDDLVVITDADLEAHKPGVGTLPPPVKGKSPARRRGGGARTVSSRVSTRGAVRDSGTAQDGGAARSEATAERREPVAGSGLRDKKLFVLVKDPEDHDALRRLKQICDDHMGLSEIVLVLGEQDKKAMRLPFRIDPNQNLLDSLGSIFTSECVKLQ